MSTLNASMQPIQVPPGDASTWTPRLEALGVLLAIVRDADARYDKPAITEAAVTALVDLGVSTEEIIWCAERLDVLARRRDAS